MPLKHVTPPLLSLSITAVTCTLFAVVCALENEAQNSSLPFSQLPLWLQIGLTSVRVLKKMVICGILCSTLSSALTIVWFYKIDVAKTTTDGVRGILTLFSLSLGCYLVLTFVPVVFLLYDVFLSPRSVCCSSRVNSLMHFLLYFIAFVFCGGIISMVFTSSIFSIIELYRRFKHSASAQ